MTGDPRLLAGLQKLNTWLRTKTADNPSAILAGYNLDGTNLRDWDSMAFTAPFGVSAMVEAGNQAWLDALWTMIAARPEGSYEDSIRLLSMIVMTGNW